VTTSENTSAPPIELSARYQGVISQRTQSVCPSVRSTIWFSAKKRFAGEHPTVNLSFVKSR
jgi:hypothetical protein